MIGPLYPTPYRYPQSTHPPCPMSYHQHPGRLFDLSLALAKLANRLAREGILLCILVPVGVRLGGDGGWGMGEEET